jgi:competence protein ComGA
MAVQAALSGHLVMATVHARNVYGALTRLEQLNVDDFYLQQAVSCVCYQRLLPTVKKQLAVLFDLLADDALQESFTKRKVGMTDAWQQQLKNCVAKGCVEKSVAQSYQAG